MCFHSTKNLKKFQAIQSQRFLTYSTSRVLSVKLYSCRSFTLQRPSIIFFTARSYLYMSLMDTWNISLIPTLFGHSYVVRTCAHNKVVGLSPPLSYSLPPPTPRDPCPLYARRRAERTQQYHTVLPYSKVLVGMHAGWRKEQGKIGTVRTEPVLVGDTKEGFEKFMYSTVVRVVFTYKRSVH